eukprot:1350776-Pyramimonas_sp.AAC.2
MRLACHAKLHDDGLSDEKFETILQLFLRHAARLVRKALDSDHSGHHEQISRAMDKCVRDGGSHGEWRLL